MPDETTHGEVAAGGSGDAGNQLQNYLVRLATDPAELGRFMKSPESAMAEAGLTAADQALLRSGNAAAIHARLTGVTAASAMAMLVVDLVSGDEGEESRPVVRGWSAAQGSVSPMMAQSVSPMMVIHPMVTVPPMVTHPMVTVPLMMGAPPMMGAAALPMMLPVTVSSMMPMMLPVTVSSMMPMMPPVTVSPMMPMMPPVTIATSS